VAYVLPQVLVFQEFTVVPAATAFPLLAHISGPHAKLIRYAETDERETGFVGYYDAVIENAFDLPARPAGGKNDASYTKVWVQDALLEYFNDTVSSASTITKVTGYNNRVRSATINFAENGDAYPRAGILLDRDVRAGDVAKVRGITSGAESITLWTYVKELVGDEIASVIDAVEDDADNANTQVLAATISQTAGAENCVTVSVSGAAYDGLVAGEITETYDIIVTGGSIDGDFTTARLRVISGSGTDDVAEVTPSAAGVPTEIGTRGLTVTFDEADTAGCSASADVDGVSPDDLIAGQRYLAEVTQAFTVPVATSAGTYTGPVDTIHIVTITRGGSVDATIKPQYKVSTTNGIDVSGPTTVAAAATPYAVGTNGATVSFDTLLLRAGDRYYIGATAVAEGPLRTVVLGHNLDSDIPAGSEVDLTLYIRKPVVEISKNRIGSAPLTNWDVSETEITLNTGITAYDSTWTDDGVEQPLEVFSEDSKRYGRVYVEARYWLTDLTTAVFSINDTGEIDSISGATHPDNPLKWGVFKALENANGTDVKYTAVADPDDADSWVKVIQLLIGRDDVYGLVPLTYDRTVLDLFAAHVVAQSSPAQNLWRVLWTNLQGIPEIPLISAGSTVAGHTEATTSDGEVGLAVVEDDPDTSGTQYTRLRFTSGNVELLTAGVVPGDIVRVLYTTDGFGNEEYQEFVIDEVQSEDQVRLISGPSVAISVAAKTEVWRTLNAAQEAEALARVSGAWGNRRIRSTWPDRIESSGTVMDGVFMNCALAALTAGVLPHQGLTNLQILGFTDVARTTSKFSGDQLDLMALSGTWIVTQDIVPAGGVGDVFTRHAVTTGDYDDVNQREEMLTRNVDSISFRFKDTMEPFIGIANVTPTMQAKIDLLASNLIRELKGNSTELLGGQLIEGTIVDLRPSTVFADRFVLKIDIDPPYPFNNLELYLQI
jgi:hypothetical protein